MLATIGGAGLAAALLQAAPNGPDNLTPDQGTQIALEAVKYGTGTVGVMAMLVPFAFYALIALIVWLVLRNKQARMKAQNDLNKLLLDKFSSGQEFGEFLGSKEGQQFLAGLRSQGRSPRDRVLGSMRVGVVMTTLGLGILGLTVVRHTFVVPGVVILSVGVGFLLSAAITKRLSSQSEQTQKPGSEVAPIA